MRPAVKAGVLKRGPRVRIPYDILKLESWQNGYCSSLENCRGNTHVGSSPTFSAKYGFLIGLSIIVKMLLNKGIIKIENE